MRKNKFLKGIYTFLACTMLLSSLMLPVLYACDSENSSGSNSIGNGNVNTSTNTQYTIQYTDENGVQSISVKKGELYSIKHIPQRLGYEFLGLFDAEIGGTQYVNAHGSALSIFTDNQNIVLYPQFKPKEYTVILDYQGAPVTGSRSFAVDYESHIAELPMGLTIANKTFTGWYTEPNRDGKQIADEYGVLPANSKVTERNFSLDDPDGNIFLYAGFKAQEYTVTLYYGNNPTPEEVIVEHGTYISDIVTETRVDGKAALTWSKNKDGSPIFTGKITEDNLVFYAVDYAPVLEFNSNGGNKLPDIIAAAGTDIILPTPTRQGYTFVGWQNADGSLYNYNTMPSKSTTLTAVWNAIITFNENGGSSVQDISQSASTKITLPECTRDGYIFAGWYLGNTPYAETSMPENSITLKAGWYKILTKNVAIIDANTKITATYNSTNSPNFERCWGSGDLREIYNTGVRNVQVTAHYQTQSSLASISVPKYHRMAWYYDKIPNGAYQVWSCVDKITEEDVWLDITHSDTIPLKSSTIYLCMYTDYYPDYYKAYWHDVWIEVTYPDMTNLYL